MEADPISLLDGTGQNLDPDLGGDEDERETGRAWERSVAVGTIDVAEWDAAAKIAGKPLFRWLAERHGRTAEPQVFVYAAGGYYCPARTWRRCVQRCGAISNAATA
jgi:L-alanine-DL-glutamate epimerase-like enolase superfamily enzyme